MIPVNDSVIIKIASGKILFLIETLLQIQRVRSSSGEISIKIKSLFMNNSSVLSHILAEPLIGCTNIGLVLHN